MKATVRYIEKNSRLGETRSRSRTVQITDPWYVDQSLREIHSQLSPYVYHDSTVRVTSYRVGRTTFEKVE